MQHPLTVLTFEGLSPAALSCYGSSWNRTPVIDAIAADGILWDRCLAISDDPNAVFHRMVMRLLGSIDRGRGPVELITDVPSITAGLDDGCFDRVEVLTTDPPRHEDLPETDPLETQLGRLFASAIQRDVQNPSSSAGVLWLHSGFLASRWDAPREFDPIDDRVEPEMLEQQVVQDEIYTANLPPTVFDSVVPPRIELSGQEHPDLVTSWMNTYAIQIQLLDSLLAILSDAIANRESRLVVAGSSGFRLGQGGWIGHHAGPLRSRDIHVPMICSRCGPLRFSQLCSTDWAAAEIGRLVSDAEPNVPWHLQTDGTRIEVESSRARKILVTPKWFFIRQDDGDEHLFFKPDDIDDFNDVARVRPDVVADLEN